MKSFSTLSLLLESVQMTGNNDIFDKNYNCKCYRSFLYKVFTWYFKESTVLIPDDIIFYFSLQANLATYGTETQTPKEIEPIVICPPHDLVRVSELNN